MTSTEVSTVTDQPDPFPRLVNRWLATKESENTRLAYRRDIDQFARWCQANGGHPLDAGEAAVSAWNRELAASGVANTTRARKLTSVSSFFKWAVRNHVLEANPVEQLSRPEVDYSTSSTPGLTKTQAIALIGAADGSKGSGRLRASALVSLLVFTGLRISEALNAAVEDLATDRGHRVLRVTRKGGKVQSVALPAPVVERVERYLIERDDVSDAVAVRGSDGRPARRPLFPGLDRRAAHRLVGRLARQAGLPADLALSPHGLRHTFATAALDAGAQLRDVQAAMGHASPVTTERYDRSRGRLDRSPSYTVASFLDVE